MKSLNISNDSNFLGLLIRRSKLTQFALCILPVLATLLVFQHMGLTSGDRTYIFHSDSMYLASLYRDIFVDGYEISAWSIPPATYVFPDIPLFFSSLAITSTGQNATLLNAIFQVLLLSWAHLLLGAAFFSGNSLKQLIFAMVCHAISSILILMVWLAPEDSVYAYTLSSGHHLGSYILSVFCVAMLTSYIKTDRLLPLLLAALIIMIGVPSDQLFFLDLILPAIVGMMILYVHRARRTALIGIATLSISGLLGYSMYRKLVGTNIVRFYDTPHSQLYLSAIKDMFADWYSQPLVFATEMLGLVRKIDLATWIILVLALVLLWIVKKKNGGLASLLRASPLNMLVVFFFVGTILHFAILILSKYVAHYHVLRYANFIFWFPVPIIAIAVATLAEQDQPPYATKVLILISLFLGLLMTLALIAQGPMIQRGHKLAACLDQNKHLYGLEYGLGTNEVAKNTTIQSETGIRVNQISKDFQTNYWINNYFWYFGHTKSPEYNFLIMQDLDPETVIEKFGSPAAILDCGTAEVYIYNRSSDFEFRNMYSASREAVRLWRKSTGR